jgi:hypothetical protein
VRVRRICGKDPFVLNLDSITSWKNIHEERLLACPVLDHHPSEDVALEVLHLHNVSFRQRGGVALDKRGILQLVTIDALGPLRPMEATAKVDTEVGVLRAVLSEDGHITSFNEDAGSCGTSGVIRPSALLGRALETSAALGSAEVTFEIQTSLVNVAHVADLLGITAAFDERFGRVDRAGAVGPQSIVGRQQLLRWDVVGAQHAGLFNGRLSTDPDPLDLRERLLPVRVSPSLVAARLLRLPFHTLGRGRQVRHAILFIVPIFVILHFRLFYLRLLPTKLPFDIVDIHPDAVGLAVALLRDPTILQPGLGGEIDRFGTVVADIVARMITVGKSDDKLSLVVY